MKHFYKPIIFLCLLCLATVAHAKYENDCYVDGIHYVLSGDEAIVVQKDIKKYSGSITIPSLITYNNKQYAVTRIEGRAFINCTNLTGITIPNSVTSIGPEAFSGCSKLTNITIPNKVTSIEEGVFAGCINLADVTIPNSVISIGSKAFWECSGLISVTIPNSVTSIGSYAYFGTAWYDNQSEGLVYAGRVAYKYKGTMPPNTIITIEEGTTGIADEAFILCSGLTSVTIPSSVTTIGNKAFSLCSGLTTVTIPNSVKTIGFEAFIGCTSLTSVTIGNSVTTIGKAAFMNCRSLASVIIPNGVTTIEDAVFYCCSNLSSVTIPNSVTTIGLEAFYGCGRLESVTIPNNVMTIGNSAFRYCSALLYVDRGTIALICLWNKGYTPYQNGTDMKLEPPYFSVSSTQTSITANLENNYEEYNYFLGEEPLASYEFKWTELPPESEKNVEVYVCIKSVQERTKDNNYGSPYYKIIATFKTQMLSPTINSQTTASSLSVDCSYLKGDATVIEEIFKFDGKTIGGNSISLKGLEPNHSYKAEYTIRVEYGSSSKKDYTTKKTIKTDALTLETAQPKVISAGNVIVAADSNLDDEEENVGFEWRRTDWTNDFSSNTGTAVLYEGRMEGYIHNLNTEKLWKYRPYYLSNSGTYYYGDWVGLDPSNTSYFEPTVHTYAKITIEGNTALVKGYALRGTDNIKVQGFKYWKQVASVRGSVSAANIPNNAITVEATGQVMTASLKGLDSESQYCFVAFVTTTEGETFYGEQQMFTISRNMTDIYEEAVGQQAVVVAYYDMNGRCIESPKRGLNILRMSDGTTRKVMIK